MGDTVTRMNGQVRVAAIYARVSSERQRQEQTIASQTVALRELAELGMPIGARRGDVRDGDIVDHPAFVPAALVVDHEQRRDVGKHIHKCVRVLRIGRQPGLGFEDDADGADGRQTAVSAGHGELHVVVDPGHDRGEHVWLKA